MPIYEYRCEQCGHELEIMQKLADAPLIDCPQCQQATLRKLISPVGFRLKGGGWYETDFKSGNKRNLADSGDKSDKKADGADKTGGAKSESTAKTEKTGKADSGKTGSGKTGDGKSAVA